MFACFAVRSRGISEHMHTAHLLAVFSFVSVTLVSKICSDCEASFTWRSNEKVRIFTPPATSLL